MCVICSVINGVESYKKRALSLSASVDLLGSMVCNALATSQVEIGCNVD